MSMTSQARPHFPPPQHQQLQSYTSSNGGFGSPPSPLQTAVSHDQQQQQQQQLNQSVSGAPAPAQADSAQQPWTYSYDAVPRPYEQPECSQYPNAQQQQHMQIQQQQQQLAQQQLVQHYQQGPPHPPPPQMALSVHQAHQQQQLQAMPPTQQAIQHYQQQQQQPQHHHHHQQQQQQQQQQLQLQHQQHQQPQHQTFAALPANGMGPSMTFHRSSLPASFGSAPSEYYGQAEANYVQHRASLVGPTAWLPGTYPFEPQGGEGMPDVMIAGGHRQPRKLSVTEMPNGSPSRSPTSTGKARKRQRSPTREDQVVGGGPKFLAKRKNSDARVIDRDGTAPTTIFQCRGFGDCNMTFTRSEHLARHIRKHTGERPFGCHCGKAFSRLDNLRQHAQTVHSDESERNELMMSELTNLHAHLAASAARDQHAHAFLQRGGGHSPVVKKHKGTKKTVKNSNEDGSSAQMANSSASPTFPQPHSAGFVPHDPSYMAGAGPHFGPRGEGMVVSHIQQHPHGVSYDLHQFGPSDSSSAVQRIPESSTSTPYPYGTAADTEIQHIGSHAMRLGPSVAPPPPGYIHVAYGDGLVLQQQQQQNQEQVYNLGTVAGAVGPHQSVSPYPDGRYPHSAPLVGGAGPLMSYPIEQVPHHLDRQAPQQPGSQMKMDGEAIARARINDEHSVHPAYKSLDAAHGESHAHSKTDEPYFGTFFSERYAPTVFGSQDASSALSTKKEDAAKASTSNAPLPGTSQGPVRPMTASGEPAILLPPLSSISRPATATSAADALSAVKQLPSSGATATPPHKAAASGTASVSWGTKTIIEGRSRPPTSSGELEASMRFHRRNSMLDLPEMGLHRLSRPTTSSRVESSAPLSGQMRPPEGMGSTSILPPPSRSGRGLGSFDGYTHHQVEKLRPFSSSGRLGSSSGLSALGDMFRTPLATRDGERAPAPAAVPASRAGRWERPPSSGQAGTTARKTSPDGGGRGGGGGSSPFRFHPPPLMKEDGASGSGSGSVSTGGAAASFFKDRPLTTSGTRRERTHLPTGRPATRDGPTRPFTSHHQQQGQRPHGGSSSSYPPEPHEFRRPFTAGELPPPRAFGSSASAREKSSPDA